MRNCVHLQGDACLRIRLKNTWDAKNNSGFLGNEQTITISCGNRAVVARALGSREYQKHYNVRCVYFLSDIILFIFFVTLYILMIYLW